jgi:hypothetical protein
MATVRLIERNSGTTTLTYDPSADPSVWWDWECPCCGRSYPAELKVCLEDGTPLRKVGCSLPFLWIG